jgi:hypothetical protein
MTWCFRSDVFRNCRPFYFEGEECWSRLLYSHISWSVHVVTAVYVLVQRRWLQNGFVIFHVT